MQYARTRTMSSTQDNEPPLTVYLIRGASFLSVFAGVIMLVAGNAQLGVAIILLSALYIALAEIINYLAQIARNSEAANRFFGDESAPEHFQREMAER
jgi:hypothetical protein